MDAALEHPLVKLLMGRLDELERKLDDLRHGQEAVVRLQERQERHRHDLNRLNDAQTAASQRIDALEKRVDQAIARVHGGWAVVVVIIGALVWAYEKIGSRL